MSEKLKHDNLSRPVFNRLSFFLLWIVLSAGIAAISHTIFLWLLDWITQVMGSDFMAKSAWRIILVDSLLLASMLAPVEKTLLKLSFGQWVKGWISARLLSTIIAVMPYILLQSFNLQHLTMNNFQNLPIILLTAFAAALPQVWILRRYVRKSWLYITVAMLSSVIPVLFVPFLQGMAFGASFTIGSSAALIALMMLWFFRRLPEEEKTKRAEATSYERLEDRSPENENMQEEDSEAVQKHMQINI